MTIATGIALPPWCTRLLSDLDAADKLAEQVAGKLTPAQLLWPPRPGSWSVGQCLEHLRITNSLYLPPIADALARANVLPVQQTELGWFPRWFIRNFIDPATQTGPRMAPPKTKPGPQPGADVLQRFIAGNMELREMLRKAGRYDVNRIRFKNPFLHFNAFTVATGLEVVVLHERRHLLQAERVTKSAGFPQR